MPERFTERITNLGEIARMINSGDGLEAILDRIVYAVCRHSDWVMSGILAIDETAGLSRSVKRFDPYQQDGKVVPMAWDLSTSPVMQVVASGEALIIPDAPNATDYPAYQEDAHIRGYRTTVILPLNATDDQGRPMTLSVQSREPVEVTEREMSFLGMVANLAAIAVDKAVRIQAEREAAIKLRETVDAYTEVMGPALAGGNVEAVVRSLDHIVTDPWLVVDLTTGTVLATRSPFKGTVGDAEWHDWSTGAGRRALFEATWRAPPNGTGIKTRLTFTIAGKSHPTTAEVQPILVDAEAVGALMLFDRADTSNDLDELRMQTVRLALGAVLMRNVIKFRGEADSQSRVMRRLFSGDWESRADLMIRSRAVGIDLEQPNRMLFVAVGDRRAAGKEAQPARLHQLIAGAARDIYGAQATMELDGMFISLLPRQSIETARRDGRIARLQDMVRWASGEEPVIVISDPCDEPSDYGDGKLRCERLVDLANSLGVTGLVTARDFGAFPLLLSIAEKSVVQEFLNQTILPIMNSPRKRERAFGETLRAFLETEGRYQVCADRLGIHVSTLRYRLSRISDQFDLDLTDPRIRFDLQIAFQIHDLTEKFLDQG